MSRFLNTKTNVVVSVADDKDERFASPLWKAYDGSDSPTGDPAPSAPGGVPAGNASQQEWADWVVGNVEGVDEAEVRTLSRNDLREKYGPKPE